MIGPLSNSTFARFAAGILGGLVMPVFLLGPLTGSPGAAAVDAPAVLMVAVVFVACLSGEMLERYQFFAAVSAPRMPGSIRNAAPAATATSYRSE